MTNPTDYLTTQAHIHAQSMMSEALESIRVTLTKEFEYTSASVTYRQEAEDDRCSHRIVIESNDDFQERAHYDHTCGIGVRFFSLEEIKSGEWKRAYESRANRELRVLARQTGDTKALFEHLTTEAGKQFATTLLATREDMAKQLPPPPEHR